MSRVEEFKKVTQELLKKIDAYEKAPEPIIIDEKDIIKTIGQALLAASPLVSGLLSKIFSVGGQFLIKRATK